MTSPEQPSPAPSDPRDAPSADRPDDARYWRLFFEQSAMGILVGDATGRILEANPMALALLGYDREGLVGANMADIVHPDDQATVSPCDNHRAALDGRPRHMDRRYRRADGVYLPVAVSFGLLDKQDGTIQVMFRDISAHQALEKQRADALAKAEAAGAIKSAFLAHMSHELRTPLNGIMGMLQLAQSACPGAEVADYLDTAMESARGLLRILSDLLEVTNIQGGQVRLAEEDFDLDAVIAPVAASLAYEANIKGLRFVQRVAPDVPRLLRGDAARLRQILFALAGNAVKFTSEGQVVLSVETVPGGGPLQLRFGLSDTGIGIPRERLPNLFEPFVQARPHGSGVFGGAGLGLCIAKGLAEEMGGEIMLASEVGRGTDVRVTLPFMLPRAEPARQVLEPAPLAGKRVLVAEDEAVNRLTIRVMLQKLGCRPQLAENGRQALAALAESAFDCVLMDMRMPELDGLSAVRAMRRGEAGPAARTMPVVALTAHALAEDRCAALEAGVDAYLVKPVDMAELGRALGQAMAGGSRAD
ncbi:MAG TPA: response regulator, partial [Solidesulfovibrio magneticus]|nr:response regulator [Solidesulfovibrio magneticus]